MELHVLIREVYLHPSKPFLMLEKKKPHNQDHQEKKDLMHLIDNLHY